MFAVLQKHSSVLGRGAERARETRATDSGPTDNSRGRDCRTYQGAGQNDHAETYENRSDEANIHHQVL